MNKALHKHTLHLFEGDYELLGQYYESLGAAKIIRTLVRKHLKALEAKTEQALPEIEVEL
jgi:hypothetical protein